MLQIFEFLDLNISLFSGKYRGVGRRLGEREFLERVRAIRVPSNLTYSFSQQQPRIISKYTVVHRRRLRPASNIFFTFTGGEGMRLSTRMRHNACLITSFSAYLHRGLIV